MSQYGSIGIVNTSISQPYPNLNDLDMVICTETSNQSIHLGCGYNTGSNATLVVTNSNVAITGDINLTGKIYREGSLFVTGVVGLSNTSGAVFVQSGSNFGIGTSSPTQALDVNGRIATSGVTRIAQDGGLSNVRINANSIVTGTINSTYLPTASTASTGIVQLSDSISTTSSTLAATSTAVKSSYDIANAALPKAGGTMTGPILGSTTDTPSAPAYTWSGDTTTGMYHAATGQVAFTASGSNIMSIGTSNNTGLVQVSGHILPTSNLAYDLGSSNMRFRDLFISGNTIDMAGTKISVDSSSNVTIRDAANNLRRLIVDEIQIGDSNSSGAIRIKRDNTTNSVKFFQVAQGSTTEVADTTVGSSGNGGGVTLSNVLPTITNAIPANGYQVNAATVPTITTKTIPTSAKVHYGRVEIGSHAGCSLSNNAIITFNVNHNIGDPNYVVYAMPEQPSKLIVDTSNYSANSFAMSAKNISGGILVNPAVNYQLIQSTLNSNVTVLAAPPSIVKSTSNITAYSSLNSTSNLINLTPFINDPYPVGYRVVTDITGNALPIGSNLRYTHNKAATASKTITLAASNQYSVTQPTFTINLDEKVITQPLASHTPASTTQNTTASGQARSSNVPSTDQELPLIWTFGTNSLGASISGNTVSWVSAGANGTRSVILNANFSDDIMRSANLAQKSITLSVTEAYTAQAQAPTTRAGTFSTINSSGGTYSFSQWGWSTPQVVMPGNFLRFTFSSPIAVNNGSLRFNISGFPSVSFTVSSSYVNWPTQYAPALYACRILVWASSTLVFAVESYGGTGNYSQSSMNYNWQNGTDMYATPTTTTTITHIDFGWFARDGGNSYQHRTYGLYDSGFTQISTTVSTAGITIQAGIVV